MGSGGTCGKHPTRLPYLMEEEPNPVCSDFGFLSVKTWTIEVIFEKKKTPLIIQVMHIYNRKKAEHAAI